MNTEYPLIIAFYMDREMMTSEFMPQYVESVNHMIAEKNLNMLAFFLPCAEGESERLECINPKLVEKTEMDRINKIVLDIKTKFSIDADINIADVEILLDDKKCECNNNCKCKNK
jgi:hypothetical protein